MLLGNQIPKYQVMKYHILEERDPELHYYKDLGSHKFYIVRSVLFIFFSASQAKACSCVLPSDQCLQGLSLSLLPCECLLRMDFEYLPSGTVPRCGSSANLIKYSFLFSLQSSMYCETLKFLTVDCLSFALVFHFHLVGLELPILCKLYFFSFGCLLKSFVTLPHMHLKE